MAYPVFSSSQFNSPMVQNFLRNHPVLAAQKTRREVTQFLNNHPQIANRYMEIYNTLNGGVPQGDGETGPASSAPAPTSSTPTPIASPAPSPAAPVVNTNWVTAMQQIWASYGLASLGGKILEFAQQGVTQPDTLEVLLRQTPEFKQRFAANEKRISQGLNALSIGHYLQLEDTYKSILSSAGLPTGFYDEPGDLAEWIAGDVDPDEIRERVAMAQSVVNSSDPTVKQQLMEFYNLGEGDLVAYFLDQPRAKKLFDVRQAFGTAQVGAAAARQGLDVGKARAQQIFDAGFGEQANAGFAQAARVLPRARQLSAIYGEDYTQTDAEDEFIFGTASAAAERERLVGREVANFSGRSGAGRGSLARRRSGTF